METRKPLERKNKKKQNQQQQIQQQQQQQQQAQPTPAPVTTSTAAITAEVAPKLTKEQDELINGLERAKEEARSTNQTYKVSLLLLNWWSILVWEIIRSSLVSEMDGFRTSF